MPMTCNDISYMFVLLEKIISMLEDIKNASKKDDKESSKEE